MRVLESAPDTAHQCRVGAIYGIAQVSDAASIKVNLGERKDAASRGFSLSVGLQNDGTIASAHASKEGERQ